MVGLMFELGDSTLLRCWEFASWLRNSTLLGLSASTIGWVVSVLRTFEFLIQLLKTRLLVTSTELGSLICVRWRMHYELWQQRWHILLSSCDWWWRWSLSVFLYHFIYLNLELVLSLIKEERWLISILLQWTLDRFVDFLNTAHQDSLLFAT